MTNKNMLSSYFDAFKNFAIFEGRTNRFDYWSFILINLFVTISFSSFPQFGGAYAVLSLLPSLAITIRRLHDVNKSGFYLLPLYLFSFLIIFTILFFISNPISFVTSVSPLVRSLYILGFVAFIGWTVYIFVLTCYKGCEEDNKYGKIETTEDEDKKAASFIYTYIITATIIGFLFISGVYAGYKVSMQQKYSYSTGYGQR
ncbi:MAG: DUF805 domain-containing protein [Alphaproteobacteria bacterium]